MADNPSWSLDPDTWPWPWLCLNVGCLKENMVYVAGARLTDSGRVGRNQVSIGPSGIILQNGSYTQVKDIREEAAKVFKTQEG